MNTSCTRTAAVVTGGARGIGQGYAIALAEAGADVAVIDVIDCDLGARRTLDIRETPEFLKIAHRVREGLRAGHSYDD